MRRKSLKVLCVIVAFFAFSVLPAMADWTTGPASVRNVIIGANPAAYYSASSDGVVTYALEAGQALNTGAFVTITLTGGAVFGSVKPLITHNAGAASATLAYLSGGAAGETSIKYTLTAGSLATPSTISFNATTAGNINVFGVGLNSNVDYAISLDNSAGGSLLANRTMKAAGKDYAFTGVNLVNITTHTPQFNTADVLAASGPYTKFTGNSMTGTPVVLSYTMPTAGIPSAYLGAKKLLVSLEGDFTGISKVTLDATAGGVNMTGCSATGVTTGGVAGEFLITGGKAYATNLIAFTGAVAVAANFAPTFYIDGTTTQTARTFYVKVENLQDGGTYNANTWLSTVQSYQIKRNGVNFSANSLGALNNIKISDKSGNVPTGGANIIISAYDAAGVKLAEVAGAPALKLLNNQTLEFTGDVIAARFVGTPMRYDFFIGSTTAVITNVKKTVEGFGSTVFTNTLNTDGGAL